MSLFGITNRINQKSIKNSEFGLYESIIHGELRPFLPEYSSTENFENIATPHGKAVGDEYIFEEIENLLDEAEEEGSENDEYDLIDYSHGWDHFRLLSSAVSLWGTSSSLEDIMR